MKVVQTQLKKIFLYRSALAIVPTVLFVILYVVTSFYRWRNDPNIDPAEREARKVLGLQIYGAINWGEVRFTGEYGSSDRTPIDRSLNKMVIKYATEQYINHKPFIYIIKFHAYSDTVFGDAAGSTWVAEYRAIVGTRNGEVYEFWWDEKSKGKSIVFFHRRWEKPTVQHKGNEILFFDASQKSK